MGNAPGCAPGIWGPLAGAGVDRSPPAGDEAGEGGTGMAGEIGKGDLAPGIVDVSGGVRGMGAAGLKTTGAAAAGEAGSGKATGVSDHPTIT